MITREEAGKIAARLAARFPIWSRRDVENEILAELEPQPAPSGPPENAAAHRTKILSALKSGSRMNYELGEICLGYRARISELRKLGFKIVAERVEEGLFRYSLKG
jgi:hypothetical protein